MNPLRIFVLAALVLVVFGVGSAEAHSGEVFTIIVSENGVAPENPILMQSDIVRFINVDDSEENKTYRIFMDFDFDGNYDGDGDLSSGNLSTNEKCTDDNGTTIENCNFLFEPFDFSISTSLVGQYPYLVSASNGDTYFGNVTILYDCHDFTASFNWSYVNEDGVKLLFTSVEDEPTYFDAGLSTSNCPVTYYWDFGDGSSAVGETVTHTFTNVTDSGFNVVLTIVNAVGNEITASYKVVPNLKDRPDIYISTLTFSDDNPEAGDEIIINATVKLLRMEIEDSFEVTFYLDGISGEWCLEPHPSCIGRQTVHRDTLSVGDEHTVSLNWNATEGTHTIYVVADSTYKIDESDEKNELSKNIIVLEEKDEEGNSSFACQGGESKIADDGCNQCVCNNGNWVCTEIDCAVSDEEEGLLPSVSLLTSLISIGLLAIFRRK